MEELSRNGSPIDKSVSDEDLLGHSFRMKPKRWLTRKEKGKEKTLEYNIDEGTLDQNEYDEAMSDARPQELRSDLARRALKMVNEKLC